MNAIASNPGARRLFVLSLVARLPVAMLSIGLLVHTQHLTGSYADAGIVAGVYAVALGVGGPVLGRLVDRRGQARVLLCTAVVEAVLLTAVALVPAGAAPPRPPRARRRPPPRALPPPPPRAGAAPPRGPPPACARCYRACCPTR